MSETIPITKNQIHLSIDIALPNNLVEVNTLLVKQAVERFLQSRSNALTRHSIEEIINGLGSGENKKTRDKVLQASEKWTAFLDEADQYAIEDEEITKNVFKKMREFRENFEMKEFSKI
ncbi:hypothetical protein [Candidatus Parabeggiatoa sp. HSG14]|uniref:hypothetical protein n=1 Tax=Candidatus Parabeggiatoa sp. HSG14 TaxID=3055593 RepID=UPI0025A77452|nr:hypothetical protein [Thiotrichales bacterium HSG14]